MKDEEMAEEYVKKEGFRSGMFGELDNITSSEANKEIKQAFLAGLKAGRPQWHDLRKDPNDLPKKEGCYLVCMEFNYRHTYILNYGQDDYDDEEKMDWYDDESTHYPKEVIAWCEIPTFDKE